MQLRMDMPKHDLPYSAPSHGASRSPPNTWFLGSPRVDTINGCSIGSSVLAQLMAVTNRHTQNVQNTAASSRQHGLRSSSDNLSCTVPPTRTKLGERAFSVTGPTACNSLPYDIRTITDTNTFKCHLKFYFLNHYFYI